MEERWMDVEKKVEREVDSDKESKRKGMERHRGNGIGRQKEVTEGQGKVNEDNESEVNG